MRSVGTRAFLVLAACGAMAPAAASASIVFDDFNVNEGHFNLAPNFSGTSVGESAMSTADRITTDGPLEGAGHEKLVLAHDGSATNLRIRFLSGSGTVASNAAFTTTNGTDGFIGFYLKTTQPGYTVALNLDGPDGTATPMDMSNPKPVDASGNWTLYEWSLDDDNQWGVVTSIGGDGTITDGTHTIDSIYLFANAVGAVDEPDLPIYLDFVAKSDSGSIAALVPEPAGAALASASGVVAAARRRRRRG